LSFASVATNPVSISAVEANDAEAELPETLCKSRSSMLVARANILRTEAGSPAATRLCLHLPTRHPATACSGVAMSTSRPQPGESAFHRFDREWIAAVRYR
jgi:hypothetical protein